MRIELHIERLVLDGVGADPGAFRAALHAELTRLAAAAPAGAWGESRGVRGLAAPDAAPDARGGHRPAALGAAVARSVHRAVVRPDREAAR
ncbi:hypothetical protein [Kitasatospora sp. NPDC059327]|uniref:hypothetical protein n=1 Tax=Kitasatospora sp. NPDC059327 TaxID=3346803 RepID=UPI0036A7AFAB